MAINSTCTGKKVAIFDNIEFEPSNNNINKVSIPNINTNNVSGIFFSPTDNSNEENPKHIVHDNFIYTLGSAITTTESNEKNTKFYTSLNNIQQLDDNDLNTGIFNLTDDLIELPIEFEAKQWDKTITVTKGNIDVSNLTKVINLLGQKIFKLKEDISIIKQKTNQIPNVGIYIGQKLINDISSTDINIDNYRLTNINNFKISKIDTYKLIITDDDLSTQTFTSANKNQTTQSSIIDTFEGVINKTYNLDILDNYNTENLVLFTIYNDNLKIVVNNNEDLSDSESKEYNGEIRFTEFGEANNGIFYKYFDLSKDTLNNLTYNIQITKIDGEESISTPNPPSNDDETSEDIIIYNLNRSIKLDDNITPLPQNVLSNPEYSSTFSVKIVDINGNEIEKTGSDDNNSYYTINGNKIKFIQEIPNYNNFYLSFNNGTESTKLVRLNITDSEYLTFFVGFLKQSAYEKYINILQQTSQEETEVSLFTSPCATLPPSTTSNPSPNPSESVSSSPSSLYIEFIEYISSLINKNSVVNGPAYYELIDGKTCKCEYIYTDDLNNLESGSEVSHKLNFNRYPLGHNNDYNITDDKDDRPYAIYIIPNGYKVLSTTGSNALSDKLLFKELLFETTEYKVYGERTYSITNVNIYKDEND